MTADKIYLVGFMAAGKTTVARALAARLGWRAEDIDELIEARERRPVADIFARAGEPYFRAVEREILKVQLPLRHVVVATGGGTFVDPRTAPRSTSTASRSGSTCRSRSCSRGCRPTAGGRWPPTGAQIERLFADAPGRVRAGAPADRCRRARRPTRLPSRLSTQRCASKRS